MNIYKEKIKIAVVAPPFSGHLDPILELVIPLLREKDKYDICIYTGFHKEEVVKVRNTRKNRKGKLQK